MMRSYKILTTQGEEKQEETKKALGSDLNIDFPKVAIKRKWAFEISMKP